MDYERFGQSVDFKIDSRFEMRFEFLLLAIVAAEVRGSFFSIIRNLVTPASDVREQTEALDKDDYVSTTASFVLFMKKAMRQYWKYRVPAPGA